MNLSYFKMRELWMFLVLFSVAEVSMCGHRTKRIINGETFNGRPFTTYHAIRYFGAMGSLHTRPFFTFGFHHSLVSTGVYGNIDCGGTLIAPMIYQTACHCVAHFLYHSPLPFIPPVLKEHWEARAFIYVGVSNQYGEGSMQHYSPVESERFVAHAKCGVLGEDGVVSYDYGLVRLEGDWLSNESIQRPFNFIEIGFAPQYTDRQIVQYHVHAMFKQAVCMIMGFGDYVRDSRSESDVLRHGWTYLMPQNLCIAKSARIKGVLIPPETRKQVMSWICTDTIQNEIYETASGDSGGPLVCEDRNFGILSGSIHLTTITGHIERHSLYSTLVHNIYASAINFRSDLTRLLYLNRTQFPPRRMRIRRFTFHGEKDAEISHSTSPATIFSIPYTSLLATLFCRILKRARLLP